MNEDANNEKTKLEALNQHLEEVKQLRPVEREMKVSGNAAKIAIDFASATAVGTLLGFGIDKWLDTLPWGLLVGLVIGTAAGIKLMLQTQANQLKAEERLNKND